MGLSRFDLAANPFAVLGATPRTSSSDLQDLAARAATTAAAAAARTLAVPRTRLAAEVSFLPGAADAAPAVLASLARGERPATLWLPHAAQANVLAHLCAAGQATGSDRVALLAAHPAPGDPALTEAINGDRAVAGIPALQPAALRTEQDGLADLPRGCHRGLVPGWSGRSGRVGGACARRRPRPAGDADAARSGSVGARVSCGPRRAGGCGVRSEGPPARDGEPGPGGRSFARQSGPGQTWTRRSAPRTRRRGWTTSRRWPPYGHGAAWRHPWRRTGIPTSGCGWRGSLRKHSATCLARPRRCSSRFA